MNIPTQATSFLRTSLGAILLLLALGCSPQDPSVECVSDAECRIGQTCEQNSCVCKTDDACAEGQYCNNWGSCQARPPCLGNQDCAPSEICNSADPTGGKCIPASRCGSSVHCDLNQYCDPITESCQPGCRNTGDCQLGHVCVAGSCVDGSTGNDCTQCPTSPDPDSSYCDYGEICNTRGQCTPHALQNSLCQTCRNAALGGISCPNAMLCLLDDAELGAQYCAPFCRSDLDCPNGYGSCNGLQLTSEGGQCTSDADCAGARRCLGSAEGVVSTCSCLTTNDCDQRGATCFLGACQNIGNPCTSNADCAIQCTMIDNGSGTPVGICETQAKACGKGEGMTCDKLDNEQADCHNY